MANRARDEVIYIRVDEALKKRFDRIKEASGYKENADFLNYLLDVYDGKRVDGVTLKDIWEILAQKLSISFHPEDNDRLTYEQAYKIAEDFAREFFWSKGYEVLFAVHTDTAHTHVHFLVSNCNVKDGKSFRRGPAELKEMCRYFGEQCRECGLTHSHRDSYYVKDKDRERQNFAEYQMKKRDKLSFREEIKVLLRNAMNRPENKTLQDVIDYAKKYYLMDVRLRGNTISYALKYLMLRKMSV